jgi:hypothetical protein
LLFDLDHYQERRISNEKAVYWAGKEAEKSINSDLRSTLGYNNIIELLNKIKEIEGEDSIGRWTAAELYRDYIVLRVYLFALATYEQMYDDSRKREVPMWNSVNQERILLDMIEDLNKTIEWANSTEGFLYPEDPEAMMYNC